MVASMAQKVDPARQVDIGRSFSAAGDGRIGRAARWCA